MLNAEQCPKLCYVDNRCLLLCCAERNNKIIGLCRFMFSVHGLALSFNKRHLFSSFILLILLLGNVLGVLLLSSLCSLVGVIAIDGIEGLSLEDGATGAAAAVTESFYAVGIVPEFIHWQSLVCFESLKAVALPCGCD